MKKHIAKPATLASVLKTYKISPASFKKTKRLVEKSLKKKGHKMHRQSKSR